MKNLILFIFLGFLMAGCSDDPSTPDPPETPSGLSSVSSDFSSITLIWNTVNTATAYILYRSADGIADYELVYDGANSNFTDTDLMFATTHYYKVSAQNEGGESMLSQAISTSTQIPDGFDVTGSPSGHVDYPFNYKEDFNGKPSYQSDPIGLMILTPISGDYQDQWVIYDQIEGIVLYYHPEITPYPSPSGWLKKLDDSETSILLSPK